MISQTSEYALRAIVCLAHAPDAAMTAREIATLGKVPPGYMAKVLLSLARAGVVRSRRGLNGGFVLARPATEMTVLDVVNAVDPIRRIHTCPLGRPEHGEHLCALHQRLDLVSGLVADSLAASSIADLLQGLHAERPLCLPDRPDDRTEATTTPDHVNQSLMNADPDPIDATRRSSRPAAAQ